MRTNNPEAPNAYVGPFHEGEQAAQELQMLMWDLLMKENKPPGAPNAYVGPFNEGEQATQKLEMLMWDPLMKENRPPRSSRCLCRTHS